LSQGKFRDKRLDGIISETWTALMDVKQLYDDKLKRQTELARYSVGLQEKPN